MSKPTLIEWKVGKDIHGRTVRLRQTKEYTGQTSYTIISEPVSQRDEGERIDGLSRENLIEIFSALPGEAV